MEKTDCWITVTDADNAEVTYDKQTTGETPEYVEKFAIHAKVDAGWENPCLWAWSAPDGTNAFEAWPGMEMKQDDNGWYTAKAPIWVNSVIINANEGSVQTDDISIDAAEVWVTVDADGKADFSYTDPEKAEVARYNRTCNHTVRLGCTLPLGMVGTGRNQCICILAGLKP